MDKKGTNQSKSLANMLHSKTNKVPDEPYYFDQATDRANTYTVLEKNISFLQNNLKLRQMSQDNKYDHLPQQEYHSAVTDISGASDNYCLGKMKGPLDTSPMYETQREHHASAKQLIKNHFLKDMCQNKGSTKCKNLSFSLASMKLCKHHFMKYMKGLMRR